MSSERYKRQISVLGVGNAGQAAIRAASVRVAGSGLGSEICALYLAGAGVGRLEVEAPLAPAVRALNSEVEVSVVDCAPVEFLVALLEPASGRLEPFEPSDADDLARGASAARWALARILSERASG